MNHIYSKLVFSLLFITLGSCWTLWPQPQSLQAGGQETYTLSPSSFKFVLASGTPQNDIIQAAFNRYTKLIFWGQSNNIKSAASLQQVVVSYTNSSTDLQFGVDESYSLYISSSGATIKATTVWGALHALETFSQFVDVTTDSHNAVTGYQITEGPITVTDSPRFPHRGLLIDSSRHFLPVASILHTIDAMTYNKLNVLHWHIVDAESFPVEVKSYPILSQKGSYRPDLTYTQDDVKNIIQYATQRGIRVLPEFDTPGHTYSWGQAIPEIVTSCPSYSANINNVPLKPTIQKTFDVVQAVYTEMASLFPDHYFHIGGDEVEYFCWKEDASITQWMNENNVSSYNQLMQLYENRVWSMLQSSGKKIFAWEEIFNGYDLINFPMDMIIQVWKDEPTLLSVAQSGIQTALSYGWYLDHLQLTWVDFYTHEPFSSSAWTPQLEQYVIGGEASCWGERVDAENLDQRIWPRTSATAERLWSSQDISDVDTAQPRLMDHICRMNRRGVASEPIAPSFC